MNEDVTLTPIQITNVSHIQVDTETGSVLLIGKDGAPSYELQFADRDCIEEFHSVTFDAVCCFHAAELRERTYLLSAP